MGRRAALVASAITLAVAAAFAMAPDAHAAAIEAEAMTTSGTTYILSDPTASGGAAVTLAATGSRVTYTGPTSNDSGLIVRAKGSQCNGAPNLRLYVDNNVIVTAPITATTWTDYTVKGNLAAGTHTIALEFTNDYSDSTCDRNVYVDKITEILAAPGTTTPPTTTPPTTTTTTTTTTTPPPSGCPVNQYSATYFNNTTLSGSPVLSQCETSVGGNWTGSPATGVNSNNYSVNYVGTLNFPVTGNYTFAADTGDSGVMVYLDNVAVISQPALGTWGRFEEVRSVTAGQHTVRVVIADGTGSAIQNFSVSQASQGTRSSNGNYFAQDSFWNTPIRASATVDPRSAGWVNSLVNNQAIYQISMNSTQWSTPVYIAPAGTPTKSIRVTNSNKSVSVPYLSSYTASPDSDAHAVIIDSTNGCLYEFQGFNGSSAIAQATYHAYTGSGGHTAGPAHSGGEFSYLAGMITPQDVSSGVIDHAIRYALPNIGNRFSYPGTRTDGTVQGGIPEGALMRLDPTLDLNSLGLTSFQKMVATALQTYGGYNADTSSAFSLSAQQTSDSAFNAAVSNLPKSLISKLQFLNPVVSSVDVRLDRSSDTSCAQQG